MPSIEDEIPSPQPEDEEHLAYILSLRDEAHTLLLSTGNPALHHCIKRVIGYSTSNQLRIATISKEDTGPAYTYFGYTADDSHGTLPTLLIISNTR